MDGIPSVLARTITSREAINSAGIVVDAALHVVPRVAEELPGVGPLIAAIGGINSVRDRLLLKKLGMFLGEQSELSAAEREAFRANLEREPEFRVRVGEHLLLLLDRLDELRRRG